MKFTIQHVVYVIKQSVSPKMFTNERLFTIQAFTITRVHCTNLFHDTTKVHIETLKGTIIANGILTSSICQGYNIGVETAVGVFYEDLLRNHTVKLSATNEEYEPESGEC